MFEEIQQTQNSRGLCFLFYKVQTANYHNSIIDFFYIQYYAKPFDHCLTFPAIFLQIMEAGNERQ